MEEQGINCRIHRNGNSSQSFGDASRTLMQISNAGQPLVRKHLGEIFHGRNYQHLPMRAAAAARDEDMAKMADILKGLALMHQVGLEIGLLYVREKEQT